MNIGLNYLDSTIDLFKYYQALGAKSISQLQNEQLHYRFHPEDNNIATIVKHMVGNMRSRFTNFLSQDGEKPWRNREDEFVDTILDKEDLLSTWNESWKAVIYEISQISEYQIENHIIYIRNEGHTIMEALNRQLAHYAYHTGQIVYLAKSILGDQWQSLSIPKGSSDQFNQEKFKQPKKKGSFLKDRLDRKNIVDPI